MTFNATINVSVASNALDANPLLLGQGIEPSGGGNNLIYGGTQLLWRESILGPARTIRPTIIRFPQGTFATAYQWEKAIGTDAARGVIPANPPASATYTGTFGTDECLNFCAQHGAIWLYVANLYTRNSADMLAHLDYIYSALSSRRGPRGLIVEIDNEPYLTTPGDGTPNYTAAQWVAVVKQFCVALRARFPGIEIAVPYRSTYDPANFIWVSTSPVDKTGFSEKAVELLANEGVQVDYWALHNSYLPDDFGQFATDAAKISAGMAAPLVTALDLARVRATIEQYPIYRSSRYAITEYTGMHNEVLQEVTRSHASAVLELDLIRSFIGLNIAFASRHHLTGGTRGIYTISGSSRLRSPHWYAFSWLRNLMQGKYLSISVPVTDSHTIVANAGTPGRAGRIPAGLVFPFVTAYGTIRDTQVQMIVINKSQADAASLTINTVGTNKRQGTILTMTSLDALNGYDVESNIVLAEAGLPVTNPMAVTVPAMSASLLRFDLGVGTQ